MAPASPLISVIIPTYNCERYLGEAVESILGQDYRPIELIVVDDGSTDRTAQVVKRFSTTVMYVFQDHGGAAAARNRGVSLAKGDFLAFLDADDLWTENKLAKQMKVFKSNPEIDMVLGHVKQFVSPDLPPESKARLKCPDEIMPGYHIGAMLVRRDSFDSVGPLASTLEVADFIEWYTRAVEKELKSIVLPDVVMKRRLHDTNLCIVKRDMRSEYVRIAKAALDRKRGRKSAPER